MENKSILHLIAYDLLYYGYGYKYFLENYAKNIVTEQQAKEIWNEQFKKICNEF